MLGCHFPSGFLFRIEQIAAEEGGVDVVFVAFAVLEGAVEYGGDVL
jgi:hypothetical protein